MPAAAREARYRLLAQAARRQGATHILTAHTRDDQAETLLMRLLRGSGIAGSFRDGARDRSATACWLARPLLDVAKAQLVATLQKAQIGFADDPTNRDPAFTRPRLRALMPALAAEGGDARNLARLAARLARANAAVEVLVDGAERYLALKDGDGDGHAGIDAGACLLAMPEEIRLRLLKRAIDRAGHEGLGRTRQGRSPAGGARSRPWRTRGRQAEADARRSHCQRIRRPYQGRAGAAAPGTFRLIGVRLLQSL